MSRAARLAVGAALATAALPGCTKTSNNEGPDSTIAQPYGAPPDTAIAQPYGAPPEPPPATDAGAGAANDAALSVPVPAYGAPPPAPPDK